MQQKPLTTIYCWRLRMIGAVPSLLFPAVVTKHMDNVPLPTHQNLPSISQLIPLLIANVHTHMLQLTSLNTLQKNVNCF
jgi:hypothetical protein